MRKRRGNASRNGRQELEHIFARVITTTDAIPPGAPSLINNRPARIINVRVQYVAATTPISFNFLVHAANGEEVARSPLLLAGTIPRTFVLRIPANTDYGLYNGPTQPVITVNTASPGVRLAVNMRVSYKYPTATGF
jgi:hypothetical protein